MCKDIFTLDKQIWDVGDFDDFFGTKLTGTKNCDNKYLQRNSCLCRIDSLEELLTKLGWKYKIKNQFEYYLL